MLAEAMSAVSSGYPCVLLSDRIQGYGNIDFSIFANALSRFTSSRHEFVFLSPAKSINRLAERARCYRSESCGVYLCGLEFLSPTQLTPFPEILNEIFFERSDDNITRGSYVAKYRGYAVICLPELLLQSPTATVVSVRGNRLMRFMSNARLVRMRYFGHLLCTDYYNKLLANVSYNLHAAQSGEQLRVSPLELSCHYYQKLSPEQSFPTGSFGSPDSHPLRLLNIEICYSHFHRQLFTTELPTCAAFRITFPQFGCSLFRLASFLNLFSPLFPQLWTEDFSLSYAVRGTL